MIELLSAAPAVQAVAVVAVVLLQAVALYAGYGVLERVVAPSVLKTLERP